LSKVILAVDIGSTKISAVIAETSDQTMHVIGYGTSKAQGVKKGVITNIELAAKSIKKALDDAQRIAGSNVSTATVSVSNAYAKSINSTGIINIPQKDISTKEINRLMETAIYNAKIPNEYDIVHVLPYNFRVDDQDFIEDPFGMNASRLEVDANIVLVQKTNLNNLKKTVKSAGLEVDNIVLSSYASSLSVLQDDEKELGVAVIDMGGQTSNLAIHSGNSIRYNTFLGVGSNHITNDLSMALHTPLQIAENVKIKYGDLSIKSEDLIELPVIGDENNHNTVSLQMVHSVIMARVEESLAILANTLEKSGLEDKIGAGVVLTGGMTKLKGLRELAQAMFHEYPVRIGLPRDTDGVNSELKDPSYSTVIGLLMHQSGHHTQYEVNNDKVMLHGKNKTQNTEDNNIKIKDQNRRVKEETTKEILNKGNDTSIKEPKIEEVQPKVQQQEPARSEKKFIKESDNFSFEDLPEPTEAKENVVAKFSSWAKQLF